jgi:cytochrome c-type biogenesis protein CcmH
MKTGMILVALMLFTLYAVAQEPLVFQDRQQQDRFDQLTRELRCLVCQNQNLADSDAPLAQDLRQEVYEMLMAGRSDEHIKQFLVERYGDFVLYRPPVQTNTYLLWLAPVVLLLIGAWILRSTISRRTAILASDHDGENSEQ